MNRTTTPMINKQARYLITYPPFRSSMPWGVKKNSLSEILYALKYEIKLTRLFHTHYKRCFFHWYTLKENRIVYSETIGMHMFLFKSFSFFSTHENGCFLSFYKRFIHLTSFLECKLTYCDDLDTIIVSYFGIGRVWWILRKDKVWGT